MRREAASSIHDATRTDHRHDLGDTSEYRILKAPKGFRWRGQDAEGLPLLSERCGRLCEPITRYFGESLRAGRVDVNSMYIEAGILRQWWAYIDANQIPWHAADDKALLNWQTALLEKACSANRYDTAGRHRSEVDVHNRTVRQLEVVFQFYLRAGANSYGVSSQLLVGPRGPITTKIKLDGLAKHRRWSSAGDPCSFGNLMWALASVRRRKSVRRPTPGEDEVTRILTRLRSGVEPLQAPQSRRGRTRNPRLLERNWLIGRAMTEGGLRTEECAQLSVTALAKGLQNVGLRLPTREELTDLDSAVPLGPLPLLDLVGFSQLGRERLVDELEHLRRRQYQNLLVRVVGKGRKERDVPFPIEFVHDLITIGVWTVRHNEVVKRGRSRSRPSAAVFVPDGSSAAQGLTKGHIGDLMKAAFAAANVPASGHRLRAWYATRTCARLFEEAYALNGHRWDQTVENLVLEQLAQALGHARVGTTVRHYLDLQLLRFFSVHDKSKLALLRKTSHALGRASNMLDKYDFARVEALVERLAAKVPGFDHLLDEVIADPAFAVASPEAVAEPKGLASKSRLKLVSEQDL